MTLAAVLAAAALGADGVDGAVGELSAVTEAEATLAEPVPMALVAVTLKV